MKRIYPIIGALGWVLFIVTLVKFWHLKEESDQWGIKIIAIHDGVLTLIAEKDALKAELAALRASRISALEHRTTPP